LEKLDEKNQGENEAQIYPENGLYMARALTL